MLRRESALTVHLDFSVHVRVLTMVTICRAAVVTSVDDSVERDDIHRRVVFVFFRKVYHDSLVLFLANSCAVRIDKEMILFDHRLLFVGLKLLLIAARRWY